MLRTMYIRVAVLIAITGWLGSGLAQGENWPLRPHELRALMRRAQPMPQFTPLPHAKSRAAGARWTVSYDLQNDQVRTVPTKTPPGQGEVQLGSAAEWAGGAAQSRAELGGETGTQGVAMLPGPVYNSIRFPFRTVYKLLVRFEAGGSDFFYACSAAAVGQFHLITAGQCVFNHDPNNDGDTADARFASNIWAWAAQTDQVDPYLIEDFPFGIAEGIFMRTFQGWIDSRDFNHDWGVITLDRRVGAHTGWMGREFGVPTSSLNFSGYPVETPFVPPFNLFQYFGDDGIVTDYTAGRIRLRAFVYGGHAGGPVWRFTGEERWIQGVISSSDRMGNAEATLLTETKHSALNAWINEDEAQRPPQPQPDLIEYLLEAETKDLLHNVASQGGTFDLEYNVFNVGHLDSGPITVNFYLSPDWIIEDSDVVVGSVNLNTLEPFSFYNPTVTLPVPATLPPGTYWAGWEMRGTVADASPFDNWVVIDDETLAVQIGGTDPDIHIEPLTLTFNQPDAAGGEPIFVEIDWMENATHSHKPPQAVIDQIVASFAGAGHPINIDVSNAIPHVSVVDLVDAPSNSPEIQTLVDQHFNHKNDSRYFYSLWLHSYSFDGKQTGSSGIADLPGRVHIVSLGTFENQTGAFSHQVGTFMHEFGHNLGQRHGGVDHANWKPNYVSIMNYFYQLDGIGPSLQALGFASDVSGFDDFGYSYGQRDDLDENNLDENVGIGLGQTIDWDCDGTITAGVTKDVQAQNRCEDGGSDHSILTDFDNWSAMRAHIRTEMSKSRRVAVVRSEPCISWAEYQPLRQKIQRLREKGTLAPEGPHQVGVGTTDDDGSRSFTIYNEGGGTLDVTDIALDASAAWITWQPVAPFSLAPGSSQQITVRVDLPQVPPGETTRLLLIRSNDPDESPFPGGVNIGVGNPER